MKYVKMIVACGGWLLMAYIAFVTLSPIEQRPHVGDVMFERAFAFGLMGFFLALAYYRHAFRIFALVIGVAIILEYGQYLIPGRHAHLADAVEKIVGGTLGVAAGLILMTLRSRLTGHHRDGL